ncbi:hypothetical protein MMC26_004016 [Xylographa opegraphella]|nr:hypothetical protein [Xylographa opegraphella]
MTSRHSTTIVPGPSSPAATIKAHLGDHALDFSDEETSPRTRVAPFPPSSLPPALSSSSRPIYPEGSTDGMISPLHRTFSEEKEAIFKQDEEPAEATTMAKAVEENEIIPADKLINGVAANPALSPVSRRSSRSLRSAASELAAARRRSSVINIARAENASKIEGLGLYSETPRDGDEDYKKEFGVNGNAEGETDHDEVQGYEEAVIAAAQQAQMNRSRTVLLGPKRSMRAKKAAQTLGESYALMRREQGGIVVPPDHELGGLEEEDIVEQGRQQADFDNIPLVTGPGDEASSRGVDRHDVPSGSTNKKFSFINALRANPPDTSIIPKRAATVPSRPKRKTTFSTPPEVDTQSARKFDRENVLNTPYPGKSMGFPSKDQDKRSDTLLDLEAHAQRFKSNTKRPDQIEILVVLHSRGGTSTKVGRLRVPPLETFEPRAILKPASRTTENEAPDGRSTAIAAAFSFRSHDSGSRITLFDDEAVSRRLLSEYRKLRGRWRILLGARSLQGACLVIYSHPYELFAATGGRDMDHFFQPTYEPTGKAWQDAAVVESRRLHFLTQYLARPGKGAGKDEVVQWLRQLGAPGDADSERVAVKFVENWSAWRLSVAFVSVLVLGVAAALLWVFLGVDTANVLGQSLGSGSTGKPAVLQKEMLSRGTGGRVESGLLLGLLVLLLGWTGLSGWALLSWLTM